MSIDRLYRFLIFYFWGQGLQITFFSKQGDKYLVVKKGVNIYFNF